MIMTRILTGNPTLLPKLSTNRSRERANAMLQTQPIANLMGEAPEVIAVDAVDVVVGIQAMTRVRYCPIVFRSPSLALSNLKVYSQPKR